MSAGQSSSSSTMWIVLAVVAGVILLLGGLGLLGWRFATQAIEQGTAGEEFGREHDNQACLDEALRRSAPGSGSWDAAIDSVFLVICLGASDPTPGFCDGVPATGILNQKEVGDWATARCTERAITGTACPIIYTQVSTFCHPDVAGGGEDKAKASAGPKAGEADKALGKDVPADEAPADEAPPAAPADAGERPTGV